MQTLAIIDLSVYLLAGIVVILYADHLRQLWQADEKDKKRTISQRFGIVALALFVGVLAGGGRYLITRMGKSSALQQLRQTFEEPPANLEFNH